MTSKEPTLQVLTPLECYATARAMAGLSWQEFRIQPLLRLLLEHLEPSDLTSLLRLLGTINCAAILKTDAAGPPPSLLPAAKSSLATEATVVIPPLPAEAQLSTNALKEAEGVGHWLSEALTWATRRSLMTPTSFLTAGLVWTLGLAIARRCAVPLHKPIFPHLYVLWVAPTSIFKKTTGMDAISDLVHTAMPHLLLPEESTPEAFIGALGGKTPPNYDQLTVHEKQLDDLGRRFAAQRGLLIDEASSLLGAARKDYMQGHAEMILRLYDAPARYVRHVRSEGKIVIRDASLCLLGATTPASLLRNTTAQSWETGELARFVLLYPEHELPYDTGHGLANYAPPEPLVNRLTALHQALPTPVVPNLPTDRETQTVLYAPMTSAALSAYAAYTKAVTYDLLRGGQRPDPRLHPNYARLHIQAAKVALALAVVDWADAKGTTAPIITLGHWARAQQIAEDWRSSVHHLLDALNRGEDSLTETRILEQLMARPEGATLRELTQRTGFRRKSIEDALKALVEAGLICSERQRRGERGPEAQVFLAVKP